MMKDRLQELQEKIEIHGDGEDLSITNHFAVIDMEGPFMADFFYKVNFLGNAIDKLTELVDSTEHLQNAMLAPLPDIKIKNKLEEKMFEIRELGNNIRKHLKEIKQMESNMDQNNARQRIMEAHMSIITERFCNIMNKYYGSVVAYQARCHTRVARQLEIAGIEKTDDEIDNFLEDGHPILYPQIIIQEKQLLNDMEDRHLDIMKLEDSIRELHAMFIDLAEIVVKQGTQLSSIENYVLASGEYIIETDGIINATKTSKRSAKRKKICLIISFICITVIVLVCLIKTIDII